MKTRYVKEIISGAVVIMALTATSLTAAETLTFSWEANSPPLDGYYMYMDNADNKILTLPADAVTVTIDKPTDGKHHAFYLTAFRGTEESGNSDLAVWSPEVVPVDRVRTFTISGIMEVIE